MPSNSLARRSQDLEVASTHALVAPIKNKFHANLKPDNSYTSIAVYNSKGADPELSKNLAKSITSVERRIHSARSSFQNVHRIINDPALALCLDLPDRKALLLEWQEIELDFEKVLTSSRVVAQRGAAMINDFLSTIIPYLFSEDNMAKKRLELKDYRETVQEGESCAGLFAENFREISKRVLDFQWKWGKHAKGSNNYLTSEISKLQSDIIAASECIGETQRNFSSFIAQKWVEEAGRQLKPATAKKGLQDLVKEVKKATKTQSKTDVQVIKETTEIKQKTDDLVVVWNFILSDLDAIEGQMKVAETSNSPQIFIDRVDRLAVQYVHLKDALQNYGIAMAKQDQVPTSFWRKLIGQ